MRPGAVAGALTPRDRGAVASGSPQAGRTPAEAGRSMPAQRNATPDAVRPPSRTQPAPAAAGVGRGRSLAPDRPSARSARDAVADGAAGRAVAVLGKNTSNVSPESSEKRLNRWALRASLRPLQDARQAKCGYCRLDAKVAVVMRDGRARFANLVRCGSVWACPVCATTIRSVRAEEVRRAYEWQHKQGGDVLMLTLTVRHAMGDDLKQVRAGVANAWRKALSGKVWQLIRRRHGITGYIRALEVTHGRNGWHPHLHILLLVERPLTPAQVAKLRASISIRWQWGVTRMLGESFVPNDHIGCDLSDAHHAQYITKLGLELSDIGSKRAAGKNRTQWQIAADWHDGRRAQDAAIWQAFTAGMKGARMLTWSKGLRDLIGLGAEATDEEIAEADESQAGDVVAWIAGELWDQLRDRAHWTLLRVVEERGAEALGPAITALLRAPPDP